MGLYHHLPAFVERHCPQEVIEDKMVIKREVSGLTYHYMASNPGLRSYCSNGSSPRQDYASIMPHVNRLAERFPRYLPAGGLAAIDSYNKLVTVTYGVGLIRHLSIVVTYTHNYLEDRVGTSFVEKEFLPGQEGDHATVYYLFAYNYQCQRPVMDVGMYGCAPGRTVGPEHYSISSMDQAARFLD
jgi:hypothetical protein